MERKTILLVEDDASVREIVRDVLKADYIVLEASRCSEAVPYLNNSLQLAIIDYMLPDCDGFDMAKAIREKNPLLPIILMTAYDHRDVIMKSLRAGLTDYIRKPLNLRYLKMKVAELLKGSHVEPDAENEAVRRREEFIMDGLEEYIEYNYMKDLTLDRVAKMAGMGRSNFCRAFKERMERRNSMNSRRGISIVVILCCLFLLGIAKMVNAKCAMIKYVVKGSVKMFSPRVPVSQAKIFIYFDDFDLTYGEAYNNVYPDFAITSVDGTFISTSFFLPKEKFSRVWGEMGCEKNAPKKIEVFIIREEQPSRRIQLIEKDFNIYIDHNGENIIQLPDITIAGAALRK